MIVHRTLMAKALTLHKLRVFLLNCIVKIISKWSINRVLRKYASYKNTYYEISQYNTQRYKAHKAHI